MLSKWLLSFFKPTEKKDIITCGDKSYDVIEKTPQLHPIVYSPWPDAEYHFVGHVVKKEKNGSIGTAFRFYDPVTKKEFSLTEELTNILFFKKT